MNPVMLHEGLKMLAQEELEDRSKPWIRALRNAPKLHSLSANIPYRFCLLHRAKFDTVCLARGGKEHRPRVYAVGLEEWLLYKVTTSKFHDEWVEEIKEKLDEE